MTEPPARTGAGGNRLAGLSPSPDWRPDKRGHTPSMPDRSKRAMSDELGNKLEARYTDGAVMISGPEAQGYELTGRVTTADGRGLRNAQVTIVDASGYARTVTTGTFGYYRFEGLEEGAAYTVGITSSRFRFAPRVVMMTENLTDVDFIAER